MLPALLAVLYVVFTELPAVFELTLFDELPFALPDDKRLTVFPLSDDVFLPKEDTLEDTLSEEALEVTDVTEEASLPEDLPLSVRTFTDDEAAAAPAPLAELFQSILFFSTMLFLLLEAFPEGTSQTLLPEQPLHSSIIIIRIGKTV